MISKSTVLILGAGSSAHAGYPVGDELIRDLSALRGTPALDDLPMGWSSTDANDFLTRLSQAGYYSIDAFLENNPGLVELGKFLIARELKRHEIIDNLFPPNAARSWYQYLLNVLLADDGAPRFQADRLGIITFNYDRSLEAYLHNALQRRFSLDSDEVAGILHEIPIVHVYGILGSYPDVPYVVSNAPEGLLAISQEIQIIRQSEDARSWFYNRMFERANDMLNTAERIFFMGFGFHSDNVSRFRFFTPDAMADREAWATATNMGPATRRSLADQMEPYGLAQVIRNAPTFTCNSFFTHHQGLE